MSEATAGALNQEGRRPEPEQQQDPEVTPELKKSDTDPEPERIEMTKDEYEAALQSETDRKVTQALKKREAEFKTRLEKEKAEARKEAEELAKMSAEERTKIEKEKAVMEAERERREFDEEKKAFAREKLEMEAVKQLSERKMPIELAPYIYGDTAEDTFERITLFEKKWQEALEIGVKERLRGPAPKATGSRKAYFTKEQVEKMSREEVAANMDAIDESAKYW